MVQIKDDSQTLACKQNEGVAHQGPLTYSYNLVSKVFVLVTRRIVHIQVFHSVKKVTQVAGPVSIFTT